MSGGGNCSHNLVMHNNYCSNRFEFLTKYVDRQITAIFPDGFKIKKAIITNIESALRDTDQCVNSVIPWRDKEFDYLVSGQYAIFLYFLSNHIWKDSGNVDAATRLFLLNKALNGIDLFYEIIMPKHFAIGHTAGMVFAKGVYGDYCVFHQGCTVGRTGSSYPTLENGVVMFPGSMIIGNCLVRENTVLTPGVTLINADTPGNCYVFMNKSGRPVFKKLMRYYADEYFVRSDSV